MQASATARTSGRAAPLLWWAAAFAAYLLAGASVFYKTDGPDLIRLLDEGGSHPWHVGYLPLLAGWRWLLHALGLEPSLLRLGTSFSALGAAVGVGAVHAGLQRLGLPALVRHAATALVAVNPATLLFASVVEFHAPLLGVVGLSFWWTTVQLQKPSWWGMALLGVAMHAAFLVHSSGLLLPAWLLTFFLARRRPLGRRDLGLATLAGAVHVGLWALLPLLCSGFYGVHADFAAAYAKETSIGRPQSLDYAPAILLQEWVWPLLPVSVTLLAAAARPALRRELLAFAVGLLPFWYLCVRQLVFEPEHGAYLLPLVPAAALLTAQALRPRVLLAMVAVAAATGIGSRLQFGDPAPYDRFARDLERAAGGQPFLVLLGPHREMTMAYARLRRYAAGAPVRDFLWIRPQIDQPIGSYGAALRDSMVASLNELMRAGAVLVTAATRHNFEDPGAVLHGEKPSLPVPANETVAGPRMLADLEVAFAWEPVLRGADGAVAVFRLRPR